MIKDFGMFLAPVGDSVITTDWRGVPQKGYLSIKGYIGKPLNDKGDAEKEGR